jgi:rRNA maturation RNase YbeY
MSEPIVRTEVSMRTSIAIVETPQIERLLDLMAVGEGTSLLVSVVLVDNEESQSINQKFLAHDYPTDVIAFDLRGEGGADGEVIVNAEMAVAEALSRGLEPAVELLFYVAHGVLHLLGYDDATDSDREAMHRLQSHYLQLLGFQSSQLP